MNEQKIFSGVFVVIMISFFSCTQILKQEIDVKKSEVAVYYDDDLGKTMVLNSGEHTIPRNVTPYFYSLEDVNIKERMLVFTKDEKEITCSVNYTCSLKSKAIRRLHVKAGSDFIDRLVKPTIRSEMRELCSSYDFAEIEASEIEKIVVAKLKNDADFSEFIHTKSFKLEIEIDEN